MNGSLLAPDPTFWPTDPEPFCDPIGETADPIPDVTDDREDKVVAELDGVADDGDDATPGAEELDDEDDDEEEAEL